MIMPLWIDYIDWKMTTFYETNKSKFDAKKVYSLARKEQRQTGGGPEIKLVTPAINRTIDLCRDSAAFNGIGGFQTSVNGNLCLF
jgi:hypothetical protein